MGDQLPKMPASFKAVLPFIRRAEELDRDSSRPESKLIAYFCRQYAMELGIKVRENDTSNEATEYLLALMDRLEEDKNKLPAFTQEEGKEICEDFALEIFSKADDEDRAGRADKNTARTFYAAGTFFDILNQFGDISEAIVEKRKYCKYKAAVILKAIKEGRTPAPGPPDGGIDAGDDLASSGLGFPSTPSTAPAPAASPQANAYAAPPAYSPPPPPQSPQPVSSPPAAAASEPAAFPSFTQSAGTIGAGSSTPPPQATNWNPPAPVPQTPAPAAAPPAQQQPSSWSVSPPPAPTYSNHMPSAPAYAAPPAPLPPQQTYSAPPPAPQPIPVRARNGAVSQDQINDAIECAKFAIAALKVKDMELAVQRLDAALRSIR